MHPNDWLVQKDDIKPMPLITKLWLHSPGIWRFSGSWEEVFVFATDEQDAWDKLAEWLAEEYEEELEELYGDKRWRYLPYKYRYNLYSYEPNREVWRVEYA